MMELMADVNISGLHKRYGAYHALRGIDLEIADGELAVLVGPSGCGKSTLLAHHRRAGGDRAKEPSRSAGRSSTTCGPRDRDVAMVFQDYALYPHMTVAREHRLRPEGAQDAGAAIDARVNRGAADARHRAVARPLPAPTLRRPAAARRHRPRHRARTAAFSCSTSLCPISMRSCATRCAARSSACIRRSRHDDLCHARPDRSDDARRPDRC